MRKLSNVGPYEKFLETPSVPEANNILRTDLQRFKSQGLGFGQSETPLDSVESVDALSKVPAKQQETFAREQVQPLWNVGGTPANEWLAQLRANTSQKGVLNVIKNAPSHVAEQYIKHMKGPIRGPGMDGQAARMVGVGANGVPNAGTPQVVQANQLALLNQGNGLRALVRTAIAATAVGGGIAAVDAVRKWRKARKLEKDLEAGASVKAAGLADALMEGPKRVMTAARDATVGYPKGGLASSLPAGMMIPLGAAAVGLGLRAGYKPVDSLTDSARERWLREKKLKARKEFHDAMAGISKEGQVLDAFAEGILDEMEKSSAGVLQDAASWLTGTGSSALMMMAGTGALAGKAIADSRDKQKQRLARLEQEILERALPTHPAVAMAHGPADLSRRLSSGEVVIPEVMPNRRKKDEGGELKLAFTGQKFSPGSIPATAADDPPGNMLTRAVDSGIDYVGDRFTNRVKSNLGITGDVPGSSGSGGGLGDLQKILDPKQRAEMVRGMGADFTAGAMGGMKNQFGNMAQSALKWIQNLPQYLKDMKLTGLRNLFSSFGKGPHAPAATPDLSGFRNSAYGSVAGAAPPANSFLGKDLVTTPPTPAVP